MSLWGGIEAGGTKFVCVVGTGPDDVQKDLRFATFTPEETIDRAINFFQRQQKQIGSLKAVGIGSFGPVGLNPDSPTFGYITSTPKPHWSYTDIVGPVQRQLGIPVAFDTDVNAAALAEQKWAAARGLDTFIYLTIGTGIGGGGMINGKLMHGLLHPEMGHVLIPHDKGKDPYSGCCPFHGDCLEGLACGKAIEERWGRASEKLPADHAAWTLEAHYLALGLVNFILTLSPQRIIMGGGVMQRRELYSLIRSNVLEILGGYVKAPAIIDQIDEYIVPPGLGDQAGVLGAIALAQNMYGLD